MKLTMTVAVLVAAAGAAACSPLADLSDKAARSDDEPVSEYALPTPPKQPMDSVASLGSLY